MSFIDELKERHDRSKAIFAGHAAKDPTAPPAYNWGGYMRALESAIKLYEAEDSGKRYIYAVAIKSDAGQVYNLVAPARHHDVLAVMKEGGAKPKEQGFLDDQGRFVGREEARKIAEEAGQLLERAIQSPDLFSEDVW